MRIRFLFICANQVWYLNLLDVRVSKVEFNAIPSSGVRILPLVNSLQSSQNSSFLVIPVPLYNFNGRISNVITILDHMVISVHVRYYLMVLFQDTVSYNLSQIILYNKYEYQETFISSVTVLGFL